MHPDIDLKSFFRDIRDFPRPGIVFKDLTPLLASPAAREAVVQTMLDQVTSLNIDAVAAIEARGFLFGMLLAERLQVPFIPVRKEGKLPYRKISYSYELEYGSATMEMHEDAVQKGVRVLVHDDLLATGGTAEAAGKMIERLGGTVAGFSFVVGLSFLQGEERLAAQFKCRPNCIIRY